MYLQVNLAGQAHRGSGARTQGANGRALVYLVTIPCVLLSAIGVLLFVIGEARYNLLLGILILTFWAPPLPALPSSSSSSSASGTSPNSRQALFATTAGDGLIW